MLVTESVHAVPDSSNGVWFVALPNVLQPVPRVPNDVNVLT